MIKVCVFAWNILAQKDSVLLLHAPAATKLTPNTNNISCLFVSLVRVVRVDPLSTQEACSRKQEVDGLFHSAADAANYMKLGSVRLCRRM
jgi:hypothetical protein